MPLKVVEVVVKVVMVADVLQEGSGKEDIWVACHAPPVA